MKFILKLVIVSVLTFGSSYSAYSYSRIDFAKDSKCANLLNAPDSGFFPSGGTVTMLTSGDAIYTTSRDNGHPRLVYIPKIANEKAGLVDSSFREFKIMPNGNCSSPGANTESHHTHIRIRMSYLLANQKSEANKELFSRVVDACKDAPGFGETIRQTYNHQLPTFNDVLNLLETSK